MFLIPCLKASTTPYVISGMAAVMTLITQRHTDVLEATIWVSLGVWTTHVCIISSGPPYHPNVFCHINNTCITLKATGIRSPFPQRTIRVSESGLTLPLPTCSLLINQFTPVKVCDALAGTREDRVGPVDLLSSWESACSTGLVWVPLTGLGLGPPLRSLLAPRIQP